MATVKTVKELVRSVQNRDSKIIILGSLSDAVYAIHKVGPFAWATCAVAIGAAAAIKIAAAGTAAGTATAITFASAPSGVALAPLALGLGALGAGAAGTAAGILGTSAFGIAVSIAVASGGLGVLSLIRGSYKIESKTSNRLVLLKA